MPSQDMMRKHYSSYFFARFPSIHFCERLMGLSFRCVQPIQQHGRRIPSFSSEQTRSTCCCRTSGVLTDSVQQIHSLRASGVLSSQCASAALSAVRAFRKSAGSLCTTPSEISFGRMRLFYQIFPSVSEL